MTLNQFRIWMSQHGVDPDSPIGMVFTAQWEKMAQLNKEMDLATSLIQALTEQMAGFVQLHEATQGKMKQLLNEVKPLGVDVKSEEIN